MPVLHRTQRRHQKKQQQLIQEINDLNNTLDQIKRTKAIAWATGAGSAEDTGQQELINNINKEIRRLDDIIYNNQIQIYRYKKELDTLKEQYSKSLVFAYKNRTIMITSISCFLPPLLTTL